MDLPSTNGDARIGPARAVIACLIVLIVTFLCVGYHDGAFGTEPVTATDLVQGSYRFKGTVEEWDPGNQTFRLRDETGAREFQWNITTPRVGQTYVVDANVEGEGKWQALALTRPLLVDGYWF